MIEMAVATAWQPYTPERKPVMDKNKKQQIDKYLEIIAQKEGITTEEVRSQIALAVSVALKSDDEKVKHFWKEFPCEGDTPTVEEVINHLAKKLAEET